MIIRKTAAEVETMARAGQVVASTLELIEAEARPGVTLAELDRIAEEHIREHGGIPSFKGYRGFPGSICASPNAMVVHGIPGPYKLADGDLLSVDVGVTLDGYVADAAITFVVGSSTPQALDLIDACSRGAGGGHPRVPSGPPAGRRVARRAGGRGGAGLRRRPQPGRTRRGRDRCTRTRRSPTTARPGRGPKLAPGMVFAIEPMITAGGFDVEAGSDGWAVFTRDGSLAAHCEHTVAITDNGPRVLTRRGPRPAE